MVTHENPVILLKNVDSMSEFEQIAENFVYPVYKLNTNSEVLDRIKQPFNVISFLCKDTALYSHGQRGAYFNDCYRAIR